MINYDNYAIEHITDWMSVSEIPSGGTKAYEQMKTLHGTTGIYQVALKKDVKEIGDDLVHSKVGYVGYSSDVLGRTYSIRAPNGDHGASRYIRQKGLDRNSEVCIRYVYCATSENAKDLENKIHSENEKRYGARFAWTEASDGTVGKYSQVLDNAKSLSSEELLRAILEFRELARRKAQEEFEEKLQTIF
jgi:hypothetical protein